MSRTLIPIYTTRGDLGGYLAYPYLYSPLGDWIGWVTGERKVYSVHGHYVGWLSAEMRILRRRSDCLGESRRLPPASPPRLTLPARAPLPPLMPVLPLGVIDVLDEEPDLLPSPDFGELRQDMD